MLFNRTLLIRKIVRDVFQAKPVEEVVEDGGGCEVVVQLGSISCGSFVNQVNV
jgi:hypothetical protein